jgi:uncharacterized membrane protein YgaE (UPF0421/DUF939 family)
MDLLQSRHRNRESSNSPVVEVELGVVLGVAKSVVELVVTGATVVSLVVVVVLMITGAIVDKLANVVEASLLVEAALVSSRVLAVPSKPVVCRRSIPKRCGGC